MLLSGFTFIRNARKYDFPIVECVESMLPLVDELVINVGRSEDDTEKLIRSIHSPKIKIIESVWDDAKTKEGLVLSEQTNIALEACQGRWCLYLQADEAIHESEHEYIRAQLEEADAQALDGMRFRYLHFYGGYSLVQRRWNWYPSEVRLVRKDSGARSFGDAQGFRKENDKQLETKLLDAHVFHYGHARDPEVMRQKIRYFHRFWHGDEHGIDVKQAYNLNYKELVWYWGTHPKSHANRIEEGASWSVRPPDVVRSKGKFTFQRVVIYCTKKELPLATELHALLEAHKSPETHIEVVNSMLGWFRAYLGNAFKRKDAALVDLTAESRNVISLLYWCIDAISGYRWRIAHAPKGKLSRFRAAFYTAINWGRHEKTDQGFVVPDSQHSKQLARWLGYDL